MATVARTVSAKSSSSALVRELHSGVEAAEMPGSTERFPDPEDKQGPRNRPSRYCERAASPLTAGMAVRHSDNWPNPGHRDAEGGLSVDFGARRRERRSCSAESHTSSASNISSWCPRGKEWLHKTDGAAEHPAHTTSRPKVEGDPVQPLAERAERE